MKITNVKFDFIHKILSIDEVEFTEFEEIIKFLKELEEQQSQTFPTEEEWNRTKGKKYASMAELINLKPGDEFKYYALTGPELIMDKTLIAKVSFTELKKEPDVKLLVSCSEKDEPNVSTAQFKHIMKQYKDGWFNLKEEIEEMYAEDKLMLISIHDFIEKA